MAALPMATVAPLPRIPILPPGDCGRLKTVVTVRFQVHRVVSELCAHLYAMKAQQQLVPRRPCAGHLRRSPGILTRSRAKKLLKRARFLGVSHGTALCHTLFEPRAAPGRSDFDALHLCCRATTPYPSARTGEGLPSGAAQCPRCAGRGAAHGQPGR